MQFLHQCRRARPSIATVMPRGGRGGSPAILKSSISAHDFGDPVAILPHKLSANPYIEHLLNMAGG